jgi:two-component system, cell cycle response regulator DivK
MEQQPTLTQGTTWLIAEDEADIRMLLAMMFQMWGYRALIFESGQKVWDWLDEVEQDGFSGPVADFVLMDIRMPGKRGNEVAKRMRAVPALARVPIVLMTAFSLTEAEREEMVSADGVDAVISKPLPDFEQLHALLHNIHNRKQTESATRDSGGA